MSKPYEDCDLLEKLILENPNDAARIAALLAQRFARRSPSVTKKITENIDKASDARSHNSDGSSAKEHRYSTSREEEAKDSEEIRKENVAKEDLKQENVQYAKPFSRDLGRVNGPGNDQNADKKDKEDRQRGSGVTAAEMMQAVRNHSPEGLQYGRRKEDVLLKASVTDETYQAHIWVDIRTFGADGSYFLPTFNLARSSLLIACYPNHPFQVNTLLEMVIERKQDHIDLNKLDGTNLMNYFRRGVTPEILEDKIYFVGKLVRIGEIKELEGYPKHKVALGVKIVQIDKKQLANWEHFLETIKNSSQSANSYERGA